MALRLDKGRASKANEEESRLNNVMLEFYEGYCMRVCSTTATLTQLTHGPYGQREG